MPDLRKFTVAVSMGPLALPTHKVETSFFAKFSTPVRPSAMAWSASAPASMSSSYVPASSCAAFSRSRATTFSVKVPLSATICTSMYLTWHTTTWAGGRVGGWRTV